MANETKEPTVTQLREEGVALAKSRALRSPKADALMDFQVWNGWVNERRAQQLRKKEKDASAT